MLDQPVARPEGQPLLDALETLFEHTLLSGAPREAHSVLEQTLGGFEHVGLRLGDFERGLRMTRALEDAADSLTAEARWRIAYDRGLYSAALGDLTGAIRAYERCLVLGADDVTTHRTLAYTLRLRGDLPAAHAHVDRSLALARAESIVGAELRALALRGAILTAGGRLDEAGDAFDEARRRGDRPTARRSIWEAEYRLARGDLSVRAISRATTSQRASADPGRVMLPTVI